MLRRLLPWAFVAASALSAVFLAACASGLLDSKPDASGKAPIERTAETVGGTIENAARSTGNPLIAWLGAAANAGLTGAATWWARRRSRGDVAANDASPYTRDDLRDLILRLRENPDLLALLLNLLTPATPAGKPGGGAAA